MSTQQQWDCTKQATSLNLVVAEPLLESNPCTTKGQQWSTRSRHWHFDSSSTNSTNTMVGICLGLAGNLAEEDSHTNDAHILRVSNQPHTSAGDLIPMLLTSVQCMDAGVEVTETDCQLSLSPLLPSGVFEQAIRVLCHGTRCPNILNGPRLSKLDKAEHQQMQVQLTTEQTKPKMMPQA